MHRYLIFILFFGIKLGAAQVIQGKITDAKTKAPLAYVNIGVLHNNTGTVSDERGKYSLDISSVNPHDTLKFSYLGYSTVSFAIKDINKNNDLGLELKPISQSIKEIIISAVKNKQIIMGNRITSKNIVVRFGLNGLGSELGTILKCKKGKVKIENVNFNLAYNAYDSLTFRVNIYNYNNNKIKGSILKEPIYIKTKLKRGTISVDLSGKEIFIEENAFLSLEWIEDHKLKPGLDSSNYQLWFSAGFLNSNSYSRKTSQGDWKKLPAGAGFWSTGTY